MNDKADDQAKCDADRAREPAEDDLAQKVLALPRELPPPGDLWLGIEGRIEAKRRRALVLGRSVGGGSILLAAAAVALFVRSAPSPRADDRTPPPIASESAPVVAPSESASGDPEDDIFPEEASYRAALAALGPTFEQGAESLPEKDLTAVKASLGAIDAAILVTRTSLVNDPEDPDLRAELDAEYEQKIDTMNDVLEWTTRS